MKSKHPFKENKNEIIYNLINSLLAGILVLFGSFITGEITHEAIVAAFIASAIVAITKFKEYWDGEAKQYSRGIFNFIN